MCKKEYNIKCKKKCKIVSEWEYKREHIIKTYKYITLKKKRWVKTFLSYLKRSILKQLKKSLRKIFGSIFSSKALDATNVPYVSEIRQCGRNQILQNGTFVVTLRDATAIKRFCNFSKHHYLIWCKMQHRAKLSSLKSISSAVPVKNNNFTQKKLRYRQVSLI